MGSGDAIPTRVPERLQSTLDELDRNAELTHVEVEHLRDALVEPGESEATSLVPVVARVLEQLDERFVIEQRERYLDDVLERFPSWHPQIVHLQQEHDLLRRQLRDIRSRFEGFAARKRPPTPQARRQLLDWIEAHEGHRHRANALVLDAFTLDVGEGE